MFQAWVVIYLFLFCCFSLLLLTLWYCHYTGSIVIWLKNIIIILHLAFWKVELVSSFLRVFTPAHFWNSCNKSYPRRNSFLPMLNKDLPRQNFEQNWPCFSYFPWIVLIFKKIMSFNKVVASFLVLLNVFR